MNKQFVLLNLEYLGPCIKKGAQTYPSATPVRSALQGPGTSIAGTTISNTIDPASESVKLGIAQDVMRQNRSQIEELSQMGIPIEEIAEPGYAYAPHVAEEQGIIDRLFGSRSKDRVLIHPFTTEWNREEKNPELYTNV